MKATFSDLQKEINDLNKKHHEVSTNANSITASSADKELELQLKEDIYDKLIEIDFRINGDEESQGEGATPAS